MSENRDENPFKHFKVEDAPQLLKGLEDLILHIKKLETEGHFNLDALSVVYWLLVKVHADLSIISIAIESGEKHE